MRQSFWVVIGSFLTVLTYTFVKLAPPETWFGDVFFVRSLFLFGVLLLAARSRGVSFKTKHPLGHLARTALGVTALLINIVTVQHLPIGTAQTLTYTAPLFVAAFVVTRALLRGRPVGMRLVAAVLAGFVGITLTLRPSFESDMIAYGALALASAVCGALSSLALRYLGRHGEPIVRTAFFFGAGCLAASVILWGAGSEKSLWELLTVPELLAVGVCTVGAQLAHTQAWGHGRTLLCANLQFSSILFGCLFGVVFFEETFDAVEWLGIALVLGTEIAAAVAQAGQCRAERRDGRPDRRDG